jgi:HPt (histidine-containing phosphotransfer) domain-containing protein
MKMQDDRASADAKLVAERFVALSDDTGMTRDELREMFLTEMGDRLELAVSALSAGDLSEAVRLVHGAAGTTGICGAAGLAENLTNIEHLASAGRSDEARTALALATAEFHLLTTELQGDVQR